MPIQRIRILLRRVQTGLYYQDLERWTPSVTEAFDFVEVEDAVKCARDSQLEGVEVVLDFNDGGGNIAVPVLHPI
jgi:hypothetical protein